MGRGGAQWANSGGEVSITPLKCINSANTPQITTKHTITKPLMHHHQVLNHQHYRNNHNYYNYCPESFISKLSWLLEGLEISS